MDSRPDSIRRGAPTFLTHIPVDAEFGAWRNKSRPKWDVLFIWLCFCCLTAFNFVVLALKLMQHDSARWLMGKPPIRLAAACTGRVCFPQYWCAGTARWFASPCSRSWMSSTQKRSEINLKTFTVYRMPTQSSPPEGSHSRRSLPVAHCGGVALWVRMFREEREANQLTGRTDLWGTRYNTVHVRRGRGVERRRERNSCESLKAKIDGHQKHPVPFVALHHWMFWIRCLSQLGADFKQQANHWLTTGTAVLPFLLPILIVWSGNTDAGDGITTSLWLAIQVSPGPWQELLDDLVVKTRMLMFAFIGTLWIHLVFFVFSCWHVEIPQSKYSYTAPCHCCNVVLRIDDSMLVYCPHKFPIVDPDGDVMPYTSYTPLRPLDRYFLDSYQ